MHFYVNGNEQSYDMFLNIIEDLFNDITETYTNPKTEAKKKPKKKDVVAPRDVLRHRRKSKIKFTPLYMPKLEDVLFAPPATIAWFDDGTKTVAIAGHDDKYDKETGLAICMLKRVLGNKEYRNIMDKHCYDEVKKENLN